jgi:hypothetical protein
VKDQRVLEAAATRASFSRRKATQLLKEGGYEAGDAYPRGSLPGPFTETVEEWIIAEVHQLVRRP